MLAKVYKVTYSSSFFNKYSLNSLPQTYRPSFIQKTGINKNV